LQYKIAIYLYYYQKMLDKIMVKLTAGGVSQEPAMSAVKTDRRQGGYLYEDCSGKISWTGK
jgi:hypothetical protein